MIFVYFFVNFRLSSHPAGFQGSDAAWQITTADDDKHAANVAAIAVSNMHRNDEAEGNYDNLSSADSQELLKINSAWGVMMAPLLRLHCQ